MTSRNENIQTKYRQVLDSDPSSSVYSELDSRSLSKGDKSKRRSEEGYKDMPWNNHAYKPKTKICEEAWYEFLQTAMVLRVIDKNRTPKEKTFEDYREPDIYAVFNKMRQDIHNELPYGRRFEEMIDKQIETEIERERRTGAYTLPVSEGS